MEFDVFNSKFNPSNANVYVICTADKRRVDDVVYSYYDAQMMLDKGMLVGYLIPEGLTVFDVSFEDFELIKRWGMPLPHITTPKGVHVWLRTTLTYPKEVLFACGLTGQAYQEGMYVVLPYGTQREMVNFNILKSIDEFPLLNPLPYNTRATFTPPISEDGYIQTLKDYVEVLQKNDIPLGEQLNIIGAINVALAETPLDGDVLGRSVFSDGHGISFTDDKGRFDHVKMVDFFLTRYPMVAKGGDMYVWFDGLYRESNDYLLNQMIMHHRPILRAQRAEVFDKVRLIVQHRSKLITSTKNVINFKNGLMSAENFGNLAKHTADKIMFTQIASSYDPNWADKTFPDVDSYFNSLTSGDKDMEKFLYQLIGYCMIPNLAWDVAFFLWGPTASNGKSTFLKLLKTVIGKDNCSSVSLEQLITDKYAPAELHGKLVNFQGETSSSYLEDISVFKQVVTGDPMMVQRKFGQPFMLEPSAKHIFATNDFPRVKDRGNAFYRRIFAVEFKARFEEGGDFSLDNITYPEVLNYIASRAAYEYSEVVRNKKWAMDTQSKKIVSQLKKNSSTVVEFWLDEMPVNLEIARTEVYTRYTDWMKDEYEGSKMVGKKAFYEELRKKFPDEYVEEPRSGNYYVTRRVVGAPTPKTIVDYTDPDQALQEEFLEGYQ